MTGRPRIVVAPDKFKSSLTADEAADAMRLGCLAASPGADVTVLPVADGGEGTLAALVSRGAREVVVHVSGPLGTVVPSRLCVLGSTVFIETAQACGLDLVPDPGPATAREASTYGVGQLILAALDLEPDRVVLGLGGSSTTDGGAGMLEALGVVLTDADGHPLGPGGAELARLARLDATGLDARAHATEFVIAHDVDSPLLGPHGAAREFAAQKGADGRTVELLEEGLGCFARIVHESSGLDVDGIPGAGAAGGMGAGAVAFLGASSVSGADLVLELLDADSFIAGADLVVVGEGRLDRQSLRGKAPAAVARRAAAGGAAVVAVVGSSEVDTADLAGSGIGAVFSLVDRTGSAREAMTHAGVLVQEVTKRAVESWAGA